MKTSPTEWVSSIKSGDTLRVTKSTRLWPLEMWYDPAEDNTLVMVTPILSVGDVCAVIDTLADDKEYRVYAALVVSTEGIGCILTDAECFEPL